ncbi:hypothetical protein OFW50_02180 [Lacticaseibacillus chiayiensis]|uniref:Uncharacterized protein n=1 Tax=Lacticaseibacillus chiayiensis TaxID=2100821 RepID=A0ABY6H6D8_9LACO|nr:MULTISPECIES: hypothetical protein [Lacticaseibacillus]MDG3060351.1 hypothetical protein [Lacticaseibacillus sp. BCRC 81376]MDG3060408.1 hypothetical protein [Lacticaseibacillus sp. BCRC 81376]UYN56933.1 hypothetical protein OFW50_02180 [Lacticaseibacillus chiayiensis]
MSNETKQDVFNALMADMSHGSEQWRARYDAALPDETEKQKNCPYCHETDPQSKHAHYGKAISDKTEYFDFVRKTKLYRRVKARIKSPEDQHPKLCVTQMNRFREVSVVLDKAINYCPICGRKL